MLGALIRDLAQTRVNGAAPVITASRDRRLPVPDLPAHFVFPQPFEEIDALWSRLITDAQAVWPIAPETGGALAELSTSVLAHDRLLLGSTPDSIKITASKFRTLRRLNLARIPAVSGSRIWEAPPRSPSGYVLKPDDGAGAADTRYFETFSGLQSWLDGQPHDRVFMVQPFMNGELGSLSVLFLDGRAELLTCNRQTVMLEESVFRLKAIELGAMESRRAAFSELAEKVAAAFPGLWGYAGIDVICQGDNIEGDDIHVLEINPRLTTSYVGLHDALGVNPAQLVLDLATGGNLPHLTVRPAPVTIALYK